MRPFYRFAMGVTAGVLALAGAASADRRQPIVIRTPPAPLGPNSLGLLEQDFQLMRRTSPNPNNFMGGRWNPGRQVIQPNNFTFFPGGFVGGFYPYYPYAYPYPY
ncbi:MAG TPA: hypothetical protein VFU47_17555, partial [Armatimonadota bacterium]|nr:hypothetical protein [Armatimonadota bacterium]